MLEPDPVIEPRMAPGRPLSCEIKKLGKKGEGIGYQGRKMIAIAGAYPGEIARAQVTRKRKRLWEAELTEIELAHPKRVAPRCDHHISCSLWQGMDYEETLLWKQDAILRHAGFQDLPVRVNPTIPSPQQFGYRGKVEFSFQDGETAYHKRGRWDKTIKVPKCHLLPDTILDARKYIVDLIRENGIDTESLAYLVLRAGFATGEVSADLYVKKAAFLSLDPHSVPDSIKGITLSFIKPESGAAKAISSDLLYGESFFHEEVAGLKFRIFKDSFFQPSPLLLPLILEKIRELGEFKSGDTVLDLYGGVGLIGFAISGDVSLVVGIEEEGACFASFEASAKLNGIDNYEFVKGSLPDALYSCDYQFNKVILDPPRVGLHPKVRKFLLQRSPEKIIYMSCNPLTLIEDLKILSEKYEISTLHPFDFFPFTPHLEVLVLLTRK